LDDDAVFCTSCGAKTEGSPSNSGEQPQPSYPAQNAYPPAGIEPPYPPMPPIYGQAGGQPPRKKPKAGLWIGLAAGLLVVIAVIVLFVYPGVLVGGGGPLSGNTVQTRFVNDSAEVFTGAFSGLKDTAVADMLNQPFELSVDMDSETDYGTSSATMDAAYDGKTLGVEMQGEGTDNALLLTEDVLYESTGGWVTGVKFDTDEDLSESMPLGARLKALFSGATGSNAEVDWKKLVEMLVNSINKDCFVKGSSETTLTMDSGDLTDMLNAFSDKLEADDDLRGQLEDFLKDVTGESADIMDIIDLFIADCISSSSGSSPLFIIASSLFFTES
jgi:hypothetical protein